MSRYTDEHITAGIGRGDHEILKFVYEHFFAQVKKYVLKNSGSEDDARDVFQEALVVVFEKVRKGDLELKCSFGTYLYAVGRHVWLKQLRAKKVRLAIHEDTAPYPGHSEQDAYGLDYERVQLQKLIYRHFSRLEKDCRELLKMVAQSRTYREIAVMMGFKSDVHARKRKLRCKKLLLKSIRKDPTYKEYFNETN
ncbi:RNA polymerase sigma factor [candidate division KSB1 bacterium]